MTNLPLKDKFPWLSLSESSKSNDSSLTLQNSDEFVNLSRSLAAGEFAAVITSVTL